MKLCLRNVLRAQAAYYIASGLWPLVSRRSFEALTGPKADWWLVQTVGLLVVANGAALAVGTRKRKTRPETITLALSTAAAFSIIDVVYVAKRELPPTYLADAALELLLGAVTVCLYVETR